MECPHCQKPLEGLVTRESLKEQVEAVRTAKDTEIRQLRDGLKDAQTKATAYDGLLVERDKYRSELEGIREATTRREAMTAAGLSPDLLDHVGVLYASSQAGVEEGKRVAFGDWLAAEDGGKAHPLLAPHYAAPQAPAGAPPAPKPPSPAAGLNAGAHAPQPPTFSTPQQLADYLASPGYRQLPADKQQARLRELEAQVNAGADKRFP